MLIVQSVDKTFSVISVQSEFNCYSVQSEFDNHAEDDFSAVRIQLDVDQLLVIQCAI